MSLGEDLGKEEDTNDYAQDPTLESNSIGIGLEVEIENVSYNFDKPQRSMSNFYKDGSDPLPNIFKYWRPIHDGSLRKGTEFIFKGALFGQNITNALSLLQSFMDEYKYQGSGPESTDRCSVHVHLDIRDLSISQLNNLIYLYIVFERVLFEYISPVRAKNNYCRPLTDSDFTATFYKVKKANTSGLVSLIRGYCAKYSALNLIPITSYGSIEFRHHPGTTDILGLKNWINIIMRLKNLSMSVDINELIDSYKLLGADYIINKVFHGTHLVEKLINSELLAYKMEAGINDVLECMEYESLLTIDSAIESMRDVRIPNFLEHYIEVNYKEVLTKSKPTEATVTVTKPAVTSVPEPVELHINWDTPTTPSSSPQFIVPNWIEDGTEVAAVNLFNSLFTSTAS